MYKYITGKTISQIYEGEDNLLIDTPWGKKRWGMLREAMELYNKQQNKEATIFSSSTDGQNFKEK
jgi:hypothetical protein